MVLIKRVLLAAGFLIAITGFLIAALSEYRSLGITIFLVGFFVVSTVIVAQMFFSPIESFGIQAGLGLRIAAVGFAILALSQLFVFLFEYEGVFGTVSFGIGIAVMIVGILLVFFRLTARKRE